MMKQIFILFLFGGLLCYPPQDGNTQKQEPISTPDSLENDVIYKPAPSIEAAKLEKKMARADTAIKGFVMQLMSDSRAKDLQIQQLKRLLKKQIDETMLANMRPPIRDTIVKFGIPQTVRTVYKGLVPNPDLPKKKANKALQQVRENFIEVQREEVDTVDVSWTYFHSY